MIMMSDISIENWEKLLSIYRESCGNQSSQIFSDTKFDRASIADDLHVLVNAGYVNIEEVKGIYLENDRAILKMEDSKYVEVKEGSQKLEITVYHKAEISDIEFERDYNTIVPGKVTFKDYRNEMFHLNLNASQHKDNISHFIKL